VWNVPSDELEGAWVLVVENTGVVGPGLRWAGSARPPRQLTSRFFRVLRHQIFLFFVVLFFQKRPT
jgi:hypothetical protein